MQNLNSIPTTLPDGRMSRKSAAAYLGIAEKTLAMHASNGTGPEYVKRGRVWYYQKDLDAWLLASKAASTAQARLKTADAALQAC